jgi:hypothetical protein
MDKCEAAFGQFRRLNEEAGCLQRAGGVLGGMRGQLSRRCNRCCAQ